MVKWIIEFLGIMVIFRLEEKVAKQIQMYLLLSLFGFILGCAPAISPELRREADTSVTFREIQADPVAYKGKIVLWGGEIIQILPQDNETTLIEVLEWPLGWREKPRRTISFQGKFLVLLKKPLDLSDYRGGTKITVAGEVEGSVPGEKIKSISDPGYRYPLLASEEIHVWKDYGYPYSNVPDYRGTSEYRYGGILLY
jgi:outer membrane lipoprotein